MTFPLLVVVVLGVRTDSSLIAFRAQLHCGSGLWISDVEAAHRVANSGTSRLCAQVLPLSASATTRLCPTRNARDGPVALLVSCVSSPRSPSGVQDLSCFRLTACCSHKGQHEWEARVSLQKLLEAVTNFFRYLIITIV